MDNARKLQVPVDDVVSLKVDVALLLAKGVLGLQEVGYTRKQLDSLQITYLSCSGERVGSQQSRRE